MPRHLIKRFIPDRKLIHENRVLKLFGNLIHSPNLWHLNRHSVSGAFAVGLFWAMIPLPVQTLGGAACAIFFRVNLPLSVMLVWLTNPFTIPPVFYLCYLLGIWIVPSWAINNEFQFSMEWMIKSTGELMPPMLLGGVILGGFLAIAGYCGMQLFWRWHVMRRYRNRHSETSSNTPSDS